MLGKNKARIKYDIKSRIYIHRNKNTVISDTKSDKSSTILLYCSIKDTENIHIPPTEGLNIPGGEGGGILGKCMKCTKLNWFCTGARVFIKKRIPSMEEVHVWIFYGSSQF